MNKKEQRILPDHFFDDKEFIKRMELSVGNIKIEEIFSEKELDEMGQNEKQSE